MSIRSVNGINQEKVDELEPTWEAFCNGVSSGSISAQDWHRVISLLCDVIKYNENHRLKQLRDVAQHEIDIASRTICRILCASVDQNGHSIYQVIEKLLEDRGFILCKISMVDQSSQDLLNNRLAFLCKESQEEWESLFTSHFLNHLHRLKDCMNSGRHWVGRSSPMVLMLMLRQQIVKREDYKGKDLDIAKFLLNYFPDDPLFMCVEENIVPFWAYLMDTGNFQSVHILLKIIEHYNFDKLQYSLSLCDHNGRSFIDYIMGDDRFYPFFINSNLSARHKELFWKLLEIKGDEKVCFLIKEICDKKSVWINMFVGEGFPQFFTVFNRLQLHSVCLFENEKENRIADPIFTIFPYIQICLETFQSMIPFLSPDEILTIYKNLHQSIVTEFCRDPTPFAACLKIYQGLNFLFHMQAQISNSDLMITVLQTLEEDVYKMVIACLDAAAFNVLLPYMNITESNYNTAEQKLLIAYYRAMCQQVQPSIW